MEEAKFCQLPTSKSHLWKLFQAHSQSRNVNIHFASFYLKETSSIKEGLWAGWSSCSRRGKCFRSICQSSRRRCGSRRETAAVATWTWRTWEAACQGALSKASRGRQNWGGAGRLGTFGDHPETTRGGRQETRGGKERLVVGFNKVQIKSKIMVCVSFQKRFKACYHLVQLQAYDALLKNISY